MAFRTAADLAALRLLLTYQGHLVANFRGLGLDQATGDSTAGVLGRQVPKEPAHAALNKIWNVGQMWLAKSGANIVLKEWLAHGFQLVNAVTPVEHRDSSRHHQGQLLRAHANAHRTGASTGLTVPKDWIGALHGVAALSTVLCTTLPDPVKACQELGEIAYSPAAKSTVPNESPTAKVRAEWRRWEQTKSSDLGADEPTVRDLAIAELAVVEFDLELTAPRGPREDDDWPGGWTVPSHASDSAPVTWRTEDEARRHAPSDTEPLWAAMVRHDGELRVLDALYWRNS